ncbi:MAG: AAA-like domain-containing protein, partial [Saprospiraceae bacterium]
MAKEFNVTGTCIPARHYMADISEKLRQVMVMVEQGRYFTINRPRQYGKTTMLASVAKALNTTETYLAADISFEGLGSDTFSSEAAFCTAFLDLVRNQMLEQEQDELAAFLDEALRETHSLKQLSSSITALVGKTVRRFVLLIDEVDKSSNNQLFIDFLGVLRNKFLKRDAKTDLTFHSIVLAGVHDVRTLKLKLRPDEETKINSPWNIASDFKVEMSLQPREIVPMLEDYAHQEQGVSLDALALAERLYYYTSGYPFLVSALCKIIAEDIVPARPLPAA